MQRRIGQVVIDSVAAESPKFTAPMLLLHGLWCTAAVWRRFMGFLAHRGWSCHALTLRGHGADGDRGSIGQVRFADHFDDLRGVVAACDAPPIVVGHDLGGLLALHSGALDVRAVVALAPLVPHGIAGTVQPTGTRFAARLAAWRGSGVAAPRGAKRAHYFGSGTPDGTPPESGRVLRELTGNQLLPRTHATVPTLMLAGTRDVVSPPDAVCRLAQHVGATLQVADGATHAMPWEPGWEQRVSEVHRWLVHTLGEDLLAMREEEEE